MSEKPSKINEKYWIFARSPEGTIRESISWFETNNSSYVKSGKMFPRDIYSDDMVIPATEEDRMLSRLDHEAIESARGDPPRSYRLLYGKWLVFAEMDQIDSLWEDLADKIESGMMPYDAKVATARQSPLRDSSAHVICIYTPDFLFRDDVRACRIMLRKLGFEKRLYYKPDIFTHRNMYRVYGSKLNHRYFG